MPRTTQNKSGWFWSWTMSNYIHLHSLTRCQMVEVYPDIRPKTSRFFLILRGLLACEYRAFMPHAVGRTSSTIRNYNTILPNNIRLIVGAEHLCRICPTSQANGEITCISL